MPPPVPEYARSSVVIAAPAPQPGYWAGGPSVVAAEGGYVLAYRLRRPVGKGRGYANVVALSLDGIAFDPVAELESHEFGAESLERPALVRLPGGRWRIYVSCATPGTLHWWVDAIDADHPSEFRAVDRRTVFAGSDDAAYKDPVIRHDDGEWRAWVCCHDIADPDGADAMSTRYATSPDGIDWAFDGTALAPRPGSWDARGARVTAVVPTGDRWLAYYDGRATAEANWHEQTGIAVGDRPDRLVPATDGSVARSPHDGHALRYVSPLALDDGGYRLYYEAAAADGSHDLRTEYVPSAESQPS
jgi:hypothetical protein